jgi:hypothetical protein
VGKWYYGTTNLSFPSNKLLLVGFKSSPVSWFTSFIESDTFWPVNDKTFTWNKDPHWSYSYRTACNYKNKQVRTIFSGVISLLAVYNSHIMGSVVGWGTCYKVQARRFDPYEVTAFFTRPNPSSSNMTLESTQPLTPEYIGSSCG